MANMASLRIKAFLFTRKHEFLRPSCVNLGFTLNWTLDHPACFMDRQIQFPLINLFSEDSRGTRICPFVNIKKRDRP